MFAANWAGMRAAGLVRGAYHFGHPGADAGAQAHLFARTVSAAAMRTAAPQQPRSIPRPLCGAADACRGRKRPLLLLWWAQVGPLRAGEFVALDIEVSDKAGPAAVAAWAAAFVDAVVQLFGLADSPV